MIKVSLGPPPANYESQVRIPGKAYLLKVPHPSSEQFKKKAFWKNIHTPLYRRHGGICNYCATYSPRPAKGGRNSPIQTSVDHYISKTSDSSLAYEWTNFRLCRCRLNERKSNFTDVLDPIGVENSWFHLDFSTFHILAAPGLDEPLRQRISLSNDRLKLNDDDDYVNERMKAILLYVKGKMSIAQLEKKYPFLAYQCRVQNFETSWRPRFEKMIDKLKL